MTPEEYYFNKRVKLIRETMKLYGIEKTLQAALEQAEKLSTIRKQKGEGLDHYFLVELEKGVWLSKGSGDPPRTLLKENAQRFPDESSATKALVAARRYRSFANAKVLSAVNDA